MIKRAFFLLFLYSVSLLACIVIAKVLIRRNRKIIIYRAIMNNLSEISSLLAFQAGDLTSEKTLLKEFDTSDIRVANLKYFFRKYNSVLYDHAETFVRRADENRFDYRLLPAIAMQESNLCKYIYEDSHNCWGWGIYGNRVTRFDSYDEAIDTISRGMKKYYIDKGLTTPEEIMRKYTPPSDGSWAYGVNTFLKVIE